MGAGWLLINGGSDPSANLCLHVLGLRKRSCRACLFCFFKRLKVLLTCAIIPWLFFWFASYVSDSTKRYTLLLLICLEAREGSFGSYSAWAEMTYLWRLPGMTGGRMKRCKIYFGHWTPGFFFREIAWWVNASLTLAIF